MWKCPKCGRTFKKENQGHYCGEAPKTIDEYINAQDEEFRSQLYAVREALNRSLIHFAANKKHIGLYPGPEAVAHFAEKLDQAGCKCSKGSIRIPYSENLPLELISEIAEWCRETGNHA